MQTQLFEQPRSLWLGEDRPLHYGELPVSRFAWVVVDSDKALAGVKAGCVRVSDHFKGPEIRLVTKF